MKILKRGKLVRKGKQFECRKCGCVFIAEDGEYKHVYFGPNDAGVTAICPCCNFEESCSKDVVLSEEEL